MAGWQSDPVVAPASQAAPAPAWANDPVVQAAPSAQPPAATSLDPDYYDRIAKLESNGNPLATNKQSGAAGLYQFMPQTAKEFGVTNPYDPKQARAGVEKLTTQYSGQLAKSLGRAPTSGEVYLSHVQGPGGAYKLLTNPDAKAVDLVGKAAVLQNGGTADMTAADFAKIFTNRYTATDPNSMGSSAAGFANRALEPYTGVTTFRGGRGAAGPGQPRMVDGHGPAQQAVKDFGVGLAHGGIDVPLNSLASGASWIGKQLGYGGAYDATQAFNDKYNQDYAANSAGNSWAGTAGNIAGGAATAALSTPAVGGLLARGLLGGGIYGAQQNSASRNGLLQDIAVNAGLGLGGGAVTKLASKYAMPFLTKQFPALAGIFEKAPPAATPAGRMEPTFGRPAASEAPTPPTNEADAARLREANFKSLGINATKGMIGRNPGVYTYEQNLAKTEAQEGTGHMVQKLQEINAGLKGAVDQIKTGTGATATGPLEAGQNVSGAFQSKLREMQANNVSPAYKAIMKPENVLPPEQFAAMTQGNPLIQGAIRSVRNHEVLGSSIAGMPDSSLPVLDLAKRHLDDLQSAAMRVGKNNEAAIVGKASDDFVAELDKAFPGYADARAAASERFHEFDTPGMHALQKGKIAPEEVITKIAHSGKVADVQALKDSLLSGTPQQIQRGKAAWGEVQGQTVDRIIAKGFGENGTGKYNPSAVDAEIKRIGGLGLERLKVILDPDQFAALQRVRLAGADAFSEPPFAAINHPNSGIFAVHQAGKAAEKAKGFIEAVEKWGGPAVELLPGGGLATRAARGIAGMAGKMGEKAAMAESLHPNIEASIAAHARKVAGAQMQKLLAKLPMSQTSAAIYQQNQRTQGNPHD